MIQKSNIFQKVSILPDLLDIKSVAANEDNAPVDMDIIITLLLIQRKELQQLQWKKSKRSKYQEPTEKHIKDTFNVRLLFEENLEFILGTLRSKQDQKKKDK